jgi:plastocyanin
LIKRFPVARALVALAVFTVAGFALAACGSSDDSASTAAETSSTAAETTATDTSAGASAGGGATVKFEADPNGQLAYTETDVTAKAGTDTIDFDNPASIGHDVVIEDQSGSEVASTDVITDSTTSTTADLKPGTYTFFCSVPGHREAGMEGTLTVK